MEKKRRVVFAIEYGQYSDQGTFGVYSTEAKAKCVVAALGGNYDYRVVPYPLDQCVDESARGLTRFLVRMNLDSGAVTQCDEYDGPYSHGDQGLSDGSNGHVYAIVWAKDNGHAVKIMADRRAERLAITRPVRP